MSLSAVDSMPAATTPAAPAPVCLHPLLQRLLHTTGGTLLDAAGTQHWAGQPGLAMLVFAEDPERIKETLDLAVIAPELHAAAGRVFRVGLLPPAAARSVAARYGVARWPAFVLLRDGQYLGAVEGLRDWDVYTAELQRLLVASPTRAPGVGIPVAAAGSAGMPCH